MLTRGIENSEYHLGIDFDNTMAETDKGLSNYSEKQFPGKFKEFHFEPPPGGFPQEFQKLRRDYLADPSEVAKLQPTSSLRAAMVLVATNTFGNYISLLSARSVPLKGWISEWLNQRGISSYFSAGRLRFESEQDRRAAKFGGAIDLGITDMLEDDPILPIRFADAGIRVAVVDQVWNKGIPDGKNVLRVGTPMDYAVALAVFKTPEALFDYNYTVRLRGQEKVQQPWVTTREQRYLAVIASLGESEKAQIARDRLFQSMIFVQPPVLH